MCKASHACSVLHSIKSNRINWLSLLAKERKIGSLSHLDLVDNANVQLFSSVPAGDYPKQLATTPSFYSPEGSVRMNKAKKSYQSCQ